ncbi:hypothetical protein RF11_04438 [Thelohanellus kitauei]|uniref:Uncharacterized protein n=1 Tax=Thelohanellus kitauei TaxID=669202 RepID=A0A0C2N487_THEKT|nr:hypothetical protein RF11_04438 [Thelohanellus kitauei]
MKTTAEQLNIPKEINDLTWDEIDAMMDSNFDCTKFIMRECHRLYTEIQRISGDNIQQYAGRIPEKAILCYFPSNNDPLNEALKTENLPFTRIVQIATKIEDQRNQQRLSALTTQNS